MRCFVHLCSSCKISTNTGRRAVPLRLRLLLSKVISTFFPGEDAIKIVTNPSRSVGFGRTPFTTPVTARNRRLHNAKLIEYSLAFFQTRLHQCSIMCARKIASASPGILPVFRPWIQLGDVRPPNSRTLFPNPGSAPL